MALRNVYLKDEQLLDLKKCAEDQGIIMTAGYGPTKEQNLCSGDRAVVKRGMDFFKGLLPRLQLMDIKVLGGGLYSYWPLDPAAPMDERSRFRARNKKYERTFKNSGRL